MEVLPIADRYSAVVVGTGSWIDPMGRKTSRKDRRIEEELVISSINGLWKISNKGKIFSEIEEPPPMGLRIRLEDEKSSKKRRMRFNR